MADFDVADLALQAIAPGNRLLYDDKGLPSVMVYVPRFKLSEVLTGGADTYHPAFIINETFVDGIYISKYQNVVEDGRAYSLPGRDPKTSITWDTARGYCEAKGKGWHMMTKAEWAMLGLWCKAHGVFPKGNNQYGKDSTETAYTAIPATYGTGTDAGKIYHTATGTGPLTWSHDGTMKGIMDLNGNVSEWTGGIRTVYGELQFLVNNNAADKSHSQAADSDQWKALKASDGTFITPNGSGTTTGSVKVILSSGKPKYAVTIGSGETGDTISGGLHTITCSSDIADAAKLVLRAYGLLPESGAVAADYGDGDSVTFSNNLAEGLMYSGGYYNNTSSAGVFYSSGKSGRSHQFGTVGFRAAYAVIPS